MLLHPRGDHKEVGSRSSLKNSETNPDMAKDGGQESQALSDARVDVGHLKQGP